MYNTLKFHMRNSVATKTLKFTMEPIHCSWVKSQDMTYLRQDTYCNIMSFGGRPIKLNVNFKAFFSKKINSIYCFLFIDFKLSTTGI